jgi:hypothetical protein
VAHAVDGRSLPGGPSHGGGASATRTAKGDPDSATSNGAGSASYARHPMASHTHQRYGGYDESTANARFGLTSITGGNPGILV